MGEHEPDHRDAVAALDEHLAGIPGAVGLRERDPQLRESCDATALVLAALITALRRDGQPERVVRLVNSTLLHRVLPADTLTAAAQAPPPAGEARVRAVVERAIGRTLHDGEDTAEVLAALLGQGVPY